MIIFKQSYNCEKPNRGWIIDMVEAFQDEELIGYIKVSYISEDNYKKCYASPLDYMVKISGWSCVESRFDMSSVRNHISKNMLQSLTWHHWHDNNLLHDIETMNQERLVYLFKRLEKDVGIRYKKAINQFKHHWCNKPVVDFIRVNVSRQRQGIGSQLYIEATKMMKEKGLSLRASTLQSDAAKAVWNKFTKQNQTVRRGKYLYLNV